MILELRPPRDNEWPICRMLLPETMAGAEEREYWLCLRPETPRTVGALSFIRRGEAGAGLRLHVLPPFRRHGVGKAMVQWLSDHARLPIEGLVDLGNEPAGAALCERTGFTRANALICVEVDADFACEKVGRVEKRALRSGWRTVPLAEAPMAQVAQLHSSLVVLPGDWQQWRSTIALTEGLEYSPVLVRDGRVVGIMLLRAHGGRGEIRSMAVTPEARGGLAIPLLALEAARLGRQMGVKRYTFSYLETNTEMKKLAERFNARRVRTVARFVLGGDEPAL